MSEMLIPLVVGTDTVQGLPVSIRGSEQRMSEYHLADGSLVRVTVLVQAVYRVPEQWDPNGNPMYVVTSQTIATVTSPESLRKKP